MGLFTIREGGGLISGEGIIGDMGLLNLSFLFTMDVGLRVDSAESQHMIPMEPLYSTVHSFTLY